MTDPASLTKDPLGHDGFKSRSFIMCAASLGLVFLASGTFLWFERITNVQWVDVTKWSMIAIPAAYGLINVGQRRMAAKAAA